MMCRFLKFILENRALKLLLKNFFLLFFALTIDLSTAYSESRPASGKNNIWYHFNNSNTAIVFVHGIFSDSREAWYHKPKDDQQKGAYWPELVKGDKKFDSPSIFLGGYYTEITAGEYSIRDAANELYQALSISLDPADAPLLDKPNIIFIAHSTGGIVVRHMLVKNKDKFRDKSIGLMLMASPSIGSKDADRFDWLADLAQQRMGAELQWNHPFLDELDKDFKNLVDRRRISNLVGVEAVENHFFVKRLRWFDKKVLVEIDSAGRYFGEPRRIPNSTHFSIVKPDGTTSASHLLLRQFYETRFAPIKIAPDASERSAPAAEIANDNVKIKKHLIVSTALSFDAYTNFNDDPVVSSLDLLFHNLGDTNYENVQIKIKMFGVRRLSNAVRGELVKSAIPGEIHPFLSSSFHSPSEQENINYMAIEESPQINKGILKFNLNIPRLISKKRALYRFYFDSGIKPLYIDISLFSDDVNFTERLSCDYHASLRGRCPENVLDIHDTSDSSVNMWGDLTKQTENFQKRR